MVEKLACGKVTQFGVTLLAAQVLIAINLKFLVHTSSMVKNALSQSKEQPDFLI